jgi:hypothetical protein
MDFGVQSHLPKQALVEQRSVERSGQHRLEVDVANHAVAKRDPHSIRSKNLEICDAMNGVHGITYGSGAAKLISSDGR